MERLFNLQLFSNTNVTTDSGMSVEMKTFYDKTLIKLAKANLVHDQFAQKRNIPANGGKTIEFRQFNPLPKALTPLTEGVTPTGKKLVATNKTATVKQYGDYVEVSDVLKMTTIDNVIVESTEAIGDQAGKTLDTITRDAINAGTNVIYVGARNSRSALTSNDTLKPIYFEKAATQLKAANAPTINGDYVAIIHPYASYDLRTSSEWIDVHKYTDANASNIFEGEIGKLGKVRFVESTEAKIWKDSTCPNDIVLTYAGAKTYANVTIDGKAATSDADVKAAIADGKLTAEDLEGTLTFTGGAKAVFSTIVTGANAYATTNVEGGGLQTIIKQLGSGDDPLNQRATIGWKAMKVSEILVEPYMVRVESLSAYSDEAEAN